MGHPAKKILIAKEAINTMKNQLTELEKIFANDIFDKRLVSKVYK